MNVTSPFCLAIAFYYVERKSKAIVAKHRIELVVQNINIAGNSASTVNFALKNRKVHDFENRLEYYVAIEAGVPVLSPKTLKTFNFSEVEVLTSKQFLMKHLKQCDLAL